MADQAQLKSSSVQMHPILVPESRPHSLPTIQTLIIQLPQETEFGIVDDGQTLPGLHTIINELPRNANFQAEPQADELSATRGNSRLLRTLATPSLLESHVHSIMPTIRFEDVPQTTLPGRGSLSLYAGNRDAEPSLQLSNRRLLAVIPVMEARAFHLPSMNIKEQIPKTCEPVMRIASLLNPIVSRTPPHSSRPGAQPRLPLTPPSSRQCGDDVSSVSPASYHRTLEWIQELGVNAHEVEAESASWPLDILPYEPLPRRAVPLATARIANTVIKSNELDISVRSVTGCKRRPPPQNIHAVGPLAAPAMLPRAYFPRQRAAFQEGRRGKREPQVKSEPNDEKDRDKPRLLQRSRSTTADCHPPKQYQNDDSDKEPEVRFPQPSGGEGKVVGIVSGVMRKRQLIDDDPKYNLADRVEERQIRRSKRLLQREEHENDENASGKKRQRL